MPFALFLPAGLGLFGALAASVAILFWQDGPARLFVFAVCLGACEWLRGHVLTGFPWNLSAYGWGASLAVLQSASLMGAYGLSFLTILFGALSTILGILFNAAFAARRGGKIQYDPRFTNDRFGIFVPASSQEAGKMESLLREAGAEEVRRG